MTVFFTYVKSITYLSASQIVIKLRGNLGSESESKLKIWGSAAKRTRTCSSAGVCRLGQVMELAAYVSHSLNNTTDVTMATTNCFVITLDN